MAPRRSVGFSIVRCINSQKCKETRGPLLWCFELLKQTTNSAHILRAFGIRVRAEPKDDAVIGRLTTLALSFLTLLSLIFPCVFETAALITNLKLSSASSVFQLVSDCRFWVQRASVVFVFVMTVFKQKSIRKCFRNSRSLLHNSNTGMYQKTRYHAVPWMVTAFMVVVVLLKCVSEVTETPGRLKPGGRMRRLLNSSFSVTSWNAGTFLIVLIPWGAIVGYSLTALVTLVFLQHILRVTAAVDWQCSITKSFVNLLSTSLTPSVAAVDKIFGIAVARNFRGETRSVFICYSRANNALSYLLLLIAASHFFLALSGLIFVLWDRQRGLSYTLGADIVFVATLVAVCMHSAEKGAELIVIIQELSSTYVLRKSEQTDCANAVLVVEKLLSNFPGIPAIALAGLGPLTARFCATVISAAAGFVLFLYNQKS